MFSVFIQPSPPRVCEKLACSERLCVWAASSEGLHLEQGGACKGSRVTSWAKQDWSSPSSPKKARRPLRLHRTTHCLSHFLPSFLSFSPSSLVHLLFFSPLEKGAVIHNPLNYQRLNYPSRSPIFSPRMEIQKQLTSSRLGTFPRKGHGGNWMTPPFTFLTMTSLLHA